MALNPQHIIDDVVALSKNKRIWLAYSGGMDSHVLLHILATSQHSDLNDIVAIHVDHGLNPNSKQWSQHCAAIAVELQSNFCALNVEVKNSKELGMEAAARQARYQAFQSKLTQDDVLLIAQHQNDQAETFLLQLLRGAGPKGLSAMAERSQLGLTQLIRPLLAISQAEILVYAKQHKLHWIEDPSNVETRWNRNYIRNKLWPVIEQRWSSAATTISRSAAHCAEATELMTDLAQQDLESLGIQHTDLTLPITQLLTLSAARIRNVLRYVIESKQHPLPSTICLQRIIDEVCLAKQDSLPKVSWSGVDVRRYQDHLYFMSPLLEHDKTRIIECNSVDDISFNDKQALTWQVVSFGISEKIILAGLTLRFRQGGEKIQAQGQSHHTLLKHLFQQWEIPPWQRDRIPLIFSGNELVAVVGHCISEKVSVSEGERAYLPSIKIKG